MLPFTPSMIAQNGDASVTLEPAGMIVMGLSVLVVCSLTLFCIIRIMRETDPADHHHAPLDIDTHDHEM